MGGCLNVKKHANLCSVHYQRLRRNGTTVKRSGDYANINKTKDTRKGYRGYLEANTIDDIRQKAKQRGKVWTLTPDEAFKLITSCCTYCGFTPVWPINRVGIDRVKNEIGYETNNCVSCCSTCNSAKGEKKVEEFKEWILALYNHLKDSF